MSNPLTAKAEMVLQRAEQKAQDLAHSDLQIEHIIEAILTDDNSLASKALRRSGVNIETVRGKTIEIEAPQVGAIPAYYNLPLETLLQLSWHECTVLQRKYIGPEHILLAITNTNDGRQWMSSRLISNSLVRSAVLKLMGVRAEDLPDAGSSSAFD